MNIKFITLAVASSIAFPVSAATVYKDSNTDFEIGGRVEGRANFSDANKTSSNSSTYEDMSRVPASDDEVDINTRHMYVGAETSMGNLYYGHQTKPTVVILTNTPLLLPTELKMSFVMPSLPQKELRSKPMETLTQTLKVTVMASLWPMK